MLSFLASFIEPEDTQNGHLYLFAMNSSVLLEQAGVSLEQDLEYPAYVYRSGSKYQVLYYQNGELHTLQGCRLMATANKDRAEIIERITSHTVMEIESLISDLDKKYQLDKPYLYLSERSVARVHKVSSILDGASVFTGQHLADINTIKRHYHGYQNSYVGKALVNQGKFPSFLSRKAPSKKSKKRKGRS